MFKWLKAFYYFCYPPETDSFHRAWNKGYNAGLDGNFDCPFPDDSPDLQYPWYCGHREGRKDKELGINIRAKI